MADSVVEIVNTTLTETELPDSSTSYDLITTDANTSYIIKDVQVKSSATDLQAEINGFPVGNWSGNLSGYEVVDTSSTVSLTSSDFPVKLVNIFANSAYPYVVDVHKTYLGNDNLLFTDEQDNVSYTDMGTSWSNFLVSSSINSGVVRYGDIVYQWTDDGDSTQSIRSWENTSTNYTNLTSGAGSYIPIWYAPEKDALYFRYSNALKKVDLPTKTVTTVNSSSFNTSGSTYMRRAYCNNWLFYVASDSKTTNIWAINSDTGVYVQFNGLGNMSTYQFGSGWKLAVSYDEATDKFYVYRTGTSTTYYALMQDILPLTKTELDALTTSTINSTASANKVFSGYNNQTQILYNYYTDLISGHPTKGNLVFHQSQSDNYNIYTIDFEKWGSSPSKKLVDRTVGTHSKPWLQSYSPSSTEVSNTPYESNPEEIKIRITGVKSTTA